jgi:hypothetical protein
MLSGRSALVTGSVDGIGFAIGEGLAAQGCSVMLNGLAEPADVEPQLERLRSGGAQARYHRADLSVPEQIAGLVAATEAAFGKIDRDRPERGVGQAARRNGRRAQRSAMAWSRSSVPFTTAVRTFSIK